MSKICTLCSRPIEALDTHEFCILCLGFAHRSSQCGHLSPEETSPLETSPDSVPPPPASLKSGATLPSRPCRLTAHIADKTYGASGEAVSVLHTMAVLQVFQAQLLESLDEGKEDPEVFKDLRTPADFALKATKKTAQAIGWSMGYMVVLHRHLWLTLTELKDADRRALLNPPVSPSDLFGDAVETIAERFSEAQKRSRAMSHFLLHRAAAQPPPRSRSSSASNRPSKCPPSASISLAPDPEPAARTKPAWQRAPKIQHVPKKDGQQEVPKKHAPVRSKATFLMRAWRFNYGHFGMDTERNREWLHASVSSQTTPVQWYGHVYGSGIQRAGAEARSSQSPCKTRDRSGPAQRERERFQQPLLCRSEESLSLAPRTFTKCVDAALSSLRARGMRVFNYLDDWLILAHSEDVLNSHKRVLLRHLDSLGLCVNVQKSALCPSQSITYLGVHLDSVSMRARLCHERIRDFLIVSSGCFQPGTARSAERISEALRPDGGSRYGVPPRSALYAPPSDMVKNVGSKEGLENGPCLHCGHSQVPERTGAMAGSRSVPPWCPAGSGHMAESCHNGPVDCGLGSSLRRSTSLRPLDRVGENMAHKSPRAESGLLSPSELHHAGDLHALSVNADCMQFGPGDCNVTLKPRSGYVPKSLSMPFRAQVITLPAFTLELAASDATPHRALCPVRALRAYVDRSAHFRQPEQLFVLRSDLLYCLFSRKILSLCRQDSALYSGKGPIHNCRLDWHWPAKSCNFTGVVQ
ncbi:hypothetical protein M9458_053727 [Cirrhinus mrigala]|uniref:ribonuclease H n=1 Tax=Cirrhinus mrigala TaxID=683832 RepID=A0ABD0MN27_CIRMR